MECDVCERPGRRKFYCEVCLKERLLIHRSSLKRLGENHQATVKRALPILEAPGGIQDRRLAKARRAKLVVDCQDLDRRHQDLAEALQRSRTALDAKRTEISLRRNRLKEARQRLESRCNQPSPSSSDRPPLLEPPLALTHLVDVRRQIVAADQYWGEVLQNLTSVRRNLISQLASIFPITAHKLTQEPNRPASQVGSSYPKNSSRSVSPMARIEWKISGMCLPAPADVKLYQHEEVSAAALYTAHFLRLAAMYLGIKLPFQLSMGPVLSISAPRNSPWKTKFSSLYPLQLPPCSNHSSSSTSTNSSSHLAFLSGLSMLAYNTYYMIETQRANSAPSGQSTRVYKADEVLQTLYAFCHTLGLGSSSHVTGKELLKRPGSPSQMPGMNLEQFVDQALQGRSDDVVEDDWNFI